MGQMGREDVLARPVGLVGSTGRSTGPHLHWGLRVHNYPADPLTLVALFPLL